MRRPVWWLLAGGSVFWIGAWVIDQIPYRHWANFPAWITWLTVTAICCALALGQALAGDD